MSKSNAFETAYLKLLFQNVPITNLGDAAGLLGSAAAGNLYLSLHTADPGEGGSQNTSELAYDSYARMPLVRNATNFPVADDTMSLGVNVDFPEMAVGESGGGTVTYFCVGTAASGAGMVLYRGTMTPNVIVQEGVTPRIKGTPSGTPSTVTEN